VRIATWNLERPLQRESRRRREISDWLHRIDADIWVLTETTRLVQPGPEFEGTSTEVTDRVQEPHENWTTIWSRFPLRRLGETRDPARAVSALISVPAGPPIIVYGTVLPWLGSRWGKEGRVGAFRRALDAQSADWADLRATHPQLEFCVAGDLNQNLGDRHYYGSKRNRAALESHLRQLELRCLSAGADDPVARASAGRRASIDHICVSPGLAGRCRSQSGCWPLGAEPDRGISDHFGFFIDIENA
jgi:endonuclease/exonuclease/phosphatase family metal-dependent hydrolase